MRFVTPGGPPPRDTPPPPHRPPISPGRPMSCVTRGCLLRRHTDHRTTYQQFGPAWSTPDRGGPRRAVLQRDPDIRRLRHPDRPRLAARDRAGPLRPAFDFSLAVGAG